MTRRIVRTIIQLTAVTLVTFLAVFFLDRNFRVLPKSMHHYMPQHHHGLIVTDITVTKCSSINVFTSCNLDTNKWHRIEKDLYLGKSWTTSAYVHVARKKEEELLPEDKVVMDVSVGRLDPTTSKKGEEDERWESRPYGLWVKRSSNQKDSDSKKAVTGIDVLFGDDAVEARDGWQITGTPLLLPLNEEIPVTHITLRRGSQKEPHKPQPRIPENGRFKIMQLADLHLSTGVGKCRDAMPEGYNGGLCEADPRTLDFVQKILTEEKPHLVVLSGDQVNGETAPDAQSAIFKIAQILIKMKIPYVSIFGNHDDEGSLPRAAQMQILESLPYSLAKAGPEEIDGVGNYYVEVLARGKSDHSALTLYMLDSHAYSPDEKKYHGYDWIKQNQIEWFKKTSTNLKKAHKEYSKVHMDLAFIHIPLPEYRDADLAIKGEWKEGVTAPNFNSGFRDALVEQGVVMVSCGHDHVNDYCSLSLDSQQKPALWMCYAGGVGFGGYAGYGGYHRRIRVFEVDTNEARITTWKRVEWGDTSKRIDEQIIVEAGGPIGIREKKA
ncbi:calcineurin-like phosphoesterase [Colletotrichum abscissum]|uniref:Calcineurin-like phosphoesterase n=5 Tax=Colletotrichum acutatum species complex TaxID=2707335 RepID=A0A9P9XB77_9PEZI|nr:calcineurin-like phosphoesterase [Colletotrichum lupini]XP_060312953.1 calcineurin-like phosphoesterase [Colletotrichum costaricense]XP_060401585.1 calcineurin-like phosphoesterase [Colletotrichum abscissum]KAI3531806.1 calcineurin-like phosphoesterase [Colletotrichum filicis]KAK0373168.1 calcineurin-like phosphoesterase [Colletotrichum limetticola]KAK1469634.1 calcineurin-like phosphoesterase [Colletotrichum melonis]KAI3546952.1 calcineurin-like phosphoesterase [Colletotrichum abscissum]